MSLTGFNRRRRLAARRAAEAHPRQTGAITKQPKRNDKKRGASKATGKGGDAS